jgi:membrane-anchored mycosin MYCP
MNAPNPHPEIVFDVAHATPVLAALTDPGYDPGDQVDNQDLQLGKVGLASTPEGVDPSALLDIVVQSVRALCRARHAGWEPVIGKNRPLDPLHPASWHVDPGGASNAVQPFSWHVDPGGVAHGPMAIEAGDEFELPTTGPGLHVRIGLLDTAIYPDRLSGHTVVAVDDAAARKGRVVDAADWEGHATFVAGCILRGAPSATIVVDSVFDHDRPVASSWEVATKMATFAYEHQVDVLNLSLGCTTEDGQAPLVLWRAVQVLTPHVQVVVATGNEPPEDEATRIGYKHGQPVWPAACPEVISVAASIDADTDELADFSPHHVPWASVVAPGADVTSAYLDGSVIVPTPGDPNHHLYFHGSAKWSGTSFAAGTVTGTLAANLSRGQTPDERRRIAHTLRTQGGGALGVPNESVRPYRG